MTLVKVFLKFECNIYSDIDFQSAISVIYTGNSQSFTELMDRLTFVSFSCSDWQIGLSIHSKCLKVLGDPNEHAIFVQCLPHFVQISMTFGQLWADVVLKYVYLDIMFFGKFFKGRHF